MADSGVFSWLWVLNATLRCVPAKIPEGGLRAMGRGRAGGVEGGGGDESCVIDAKRFAVWEGDETGLAPARHRSRDGFESRDSGAS